MSRKKRIEQSTVLSCSVQLDKDMHNNIFFGIVDHSSST
jgi:hypothetical protein